MFAGNTDYEILTPSGWKHFKGITKVKNKKTFRITLGNGSVVDATVGHYFFKNNKKTKLSEISIGDLIDTINGNQKVVDIKELHKTTVYDIVEVDDSNHQFIVNNCFITKNCDEFSFVRPTIAREFWASISPTLATGGKAIITSTPNSDDDQFSHIWREANKKMDEYGNERPIGRNGFAPYIATWERHPDRDEAWAAQELAALGEERFRREHNAEFIIYDETLINSLFLSEMESTSYIMKQGQVRWFDKPRPGNLYLVALDPSLGTGGDNAAIQVFQLQGMKQIAEWMHNKTPIIQQVAILREITKYIADETGDLNNVYYTVENNTLGEAALQQIAEIGEENINGYFMTEPSAGAGKRYRKGFNTSNSKKLAACAKLKHWLETRKMTVFSKPLISELKTFVSAGAGFSAKQGENDDLVSSTLLIVRMAVLLKQYESEVSLELEDDIDDLIAPMPFVII